MYSQINSVPTPLLSWKKPGKPIYHVFDKVSASFGIVSFVNDTVVPLSVAEFSSADDFSITAFTATSPLTPVPENISDAASNAFSLVNFAVNGPVTLSGNSDSSAAAFSVTSFLVFAPINESVGDSATVNFAITAFTV